VEVPGSELWGALVVEDEEDGVVELVVAGVVEVVSVQPEVPAAATVGVVDWASTVESVCVWIRPDGTVGLVFAFSLAFAAAVPVVALTVCLFTVLCAVVAVVLAGEALCGLTTGW
jgi:hypothetical protein